jgi:hypothetical protein
MSEHWRSALEHIPFLALSNGSIRPNWNAIIQVGLTGAVAGLVASQIMVVRLEERVSNHEKRIALCETALAEHVTTMAESSAKLRERIASCEAKIK